MNIESSMDVFKNKDIFTKWISFILISSTDLQCIILNSKKTNFWRTQPDKPDTYLATIEAIYYFLLEYHLEFLETTTEYKGQYDNLLYFYSFMYKLVQQSAVERENEEREAKKKEQMKDNSDGGDRKDVETKE